jgi:hypothetical protein
VEFSQSLDTCEREVSASVVSLFNGGERIQRTGRSTRSTQEIALYGGVPTEIFFKNFDTGECVQISAKAQCVLAHGERDVLIARFYWRDESLAGEEECRNLWHARVRSLPLEYGEIPNVFL